VRLPSQTIQSLTTDLGREVTYAISTRWGVLLPLLSFEWEHEFLADSRTVTGSIVSDPTTAVSVLTNSPDRDYFNRNHSPFPTAARVGAEEPGRQAGSACGRSAVPGVRSAACVASSR
jgi:Autotransporter beta-domain